jgi:hypothetical protein
MATGYGLDDRGSLVRVPARSSADRLWDPPNYAVVAGALSPGMKWLRL